MNKQFTLPEVSASGKKWFVWFRYFDQATGKMKLIIKKGGANSSSLSTTERLAQLKALQKALKYKLEKQGWNPITNTYPEAVKVEMNLLKLQQMVLMEALEYSYNRGKKKWKPKTIQDYGTMFKYLKEGIYSLRVEYMKLAELRAMHCRRIIEETISIRKLGAAGFNKYRDFFSSLLGPLSKDEIIEYNPVEKIDALKAPVNFAHRPPNEREQALISARAKQNHYHYYRYLSVLYGCAFRPVEVLSLQIKFLHPVDQVFRLPAEDGKTDIAREVAIPKWVMALLNEMNLHAYPETHYIFGSGHGKGKKKTDVSFMPSEKRLHRNTTNVWWNNVIRNPIEEGGLGLDVDQYGLKKKSGDDMVYLQKKMHVDKLLELPKQQMGHTNDSMTEIYVTAHKKIIKDLVKESMPEL